MINSVQKKILLFLVMTTNVTVPMEERFLRNITQQGFCDASVNGVIPMGIQFPFDSAGQQAVDSFYAGNVPSVLKNMWHVMVLVFNISQLVSMKKKYCLFGTQLMHMNALDKVSFYTKSLCSLVESLTYAKIGKHSTIDSEIHVVRIISSMMLVSNFIYQDALLALLKKSWKEFHPELTIKEKVNISVVSDAEVDIIAEPDISDAKCAVCWENEAGKEYVNPCQQKDHIFCKECLMLNFEKQKEKFSFMNKDSFFCDLCAKEVLFNDDKFEITVPNSKMTLKSWAEHIDKPHIYLYIMGMYTLSLLLYSYLF